MQSRSWEDQRNQRAFQRAGPEQFAAAAAASSPKRTSLALNDRVCTGTSSVSQYSVVPSISQYTPAFLGAFAKLRKATTSFVMFVRPHETTRPTGRIFMKFDI